MINIMLFNIWLLLKTVFHTLTPSFYLFCLLIYRQSSRLTNGRWTSCSSRLNRIEKGYWWKYVSYSIGILMGWLDKCHVKIKNPLLKHDNLSEKNISTFFKCNPVCIQSQIWSIRRFIRFGDAREKIVFSLICTQVESFVISSRTRFWRTIQINLHKSGNLGSGIVSHCFFVRVRRNDYSCSSLIFLLGYFDDFFQNQESILHWVTVGFVQAFP